MATLGEAYIEVRADLRPFIRDLEKELKTASRIFERTLRETMSRDVVEAARNSGDKIGTELGGRTRRGMQKELGDKTKSPYVQITSALASALDDGISALPMEVKAAITTGIIASIPIISGALTGAIVAATAAGTAGIGAAFAFQFEDVRDKGTETFGSIRETVVRAAEAFGPIMLQTLDRLDSDFALIGIRLESVFDKAATFVEPLTRGATAGLERFLIGLDRALAKSGGFVAVLERGISDIGAAAGVALDILASTGEDGQRALADLLAIIEGLIIATAKFLAIATEVYGTLRDITQDLPVLSAPLALFFNAVDEGTRSNVAFAETNVELANSFDGTIAATNAQEKALRDLEKEYRDTRDTLFDVIDAELDWQQSLDDVRESLKDTDGTLKFTSEEGRRAIGDISDALKAAERRAQDRLATHELTAEQAKKLYDDEITQLKKVARQAGISDKEFDTLFADITKAADVNFDKQAESIEKSKKPVIDLRKEVGKLGSALGGAAANAALLAASVAASHLPQPKGGGNIAYADGGFATYPQTASLAEDGTELILPLSKPRRTAQLLQQAGLADATSGTPVVYVYIGDEQINARIDSRIEKSNRITAQQLAYGVR